MSDPHLPFLAAVCAAPADDVPRLVYADWLDEHGESERAEFVRVQVELASPKPPPCSCGADCSPHAIGCVFYVWSSLRDDLRRRERELIVGSAGQWVPRLPGCRTFGRVHWRGSDYTTHGGWSHSEPNTPPVVGTVTYRRGFVAEVACTAAAAIRHLADIRKCHPIERVTLTTMPATENGWRNGTARLVGMTEWRSTRGIVEERPLAEMLLRREFEGISFQLPSPEPALVG